MRVDTAFVNGLLVTPSGVVPGCIGVKDGRVALLSEHPPEALETLDLQGRHVLPGLIDAHVHFRDPGFPEWEDFDSGTAAAAAGGVTTVFEMPGSHVGISTADLLVERAATVQKRARIDFALFGGASHENLDDIPGLARAGAIAFKTFLIRPYDTRAVNFSRMCVENDAQLMDTWEAVGKTGLVGAAHCENQVLIDRFIGRLQAEGRQDPTAVQESRPPVTEIEAVSRAIMIAREAGSRLHIVHLTAGGALEAVAAARSAGQDVTCEATPPHLFFTSDQVATDGPYALHVPPLREASDVQALWNGLRQGTVDFIATDHAAFSDPADKEVGWENSWQVKCGDALIESMLPLLLTEVNAGRFTLMDLARWCSERPAQIFGLYPRKGTLQVGADADLTIVNLEQEFRIDASRFYSRGAPNARPFDGRLCKGRPVMTVVRGQVVMRDGQMVSGPGWGIWQKPGANTGSKGSS